MSEEPATVDMLYLDAEHFALTAEAQQPPLEPRERVIPVGRPFPGLLPSRAPVPATEEGREVIEDSDAYKDLLAAAMYGHSSSEARELIDAFAHELAEQQRAVNFDWYEEHAEGAAMARDHLADLIDPNAGPVRPDEEETA